MLRVGVIGLGIGRQHAEYLDAHPGCEVTTLCDLSEARLEEAARSLPGRKQTTRAEEVVGDPELDLVVVASHDDVHHEQVSAALRNGKHVFVEKPVCLRRDEAEEIRKLLRERPHLQLSSNLVLRLSSRFRELKRRIDAGAFGRIFCVEADYQYGRLHKITEGWRGRIDAYSVVLGGGVHMVDLLLWLTGDRVEEVVAMGTDIASRGSRFRPNDTVLALLRMRSGAIAKIGANFGCARPHFHGLSVYGTAATFESRPESGLYYTSSDPQAAPEVSEAPYRDYRRPELLWSFVDSILGAGRPLVSCEDVFRSAAVCFAIDEAQRTGQPVKVLALESIET